MKDKKVFLNILLRNHTNTGIFMVTSRQNFEMKYVFDAFSPLTSIHFGAPHSLFPPHHSPPLTFPYLLPKFPMIRFCSVATLNTCTKHPECFSSHAFPIPKLRNHFFILSIHQKVPIQSIPLSLDIKSWI